MKKVDQQIIGWSVLGAGVPKASGPRLVSLEITLGPRQRAGDPDAYWKSLLDALVKCGALVDDNRQWCQLGPVTFKRGDRPATVIKLETVYPCHQRYEELEDVQAAQKKTYRLTPF